MGGNVYNVATDDYADADLFGNATSDKKQKPSRVIVRDCDLVNHKELLEKTEIPYTEGKTEVVIDRITSAASPRQIERVPAGTIFDFEVVLRVFEDDEQALHLEILKQGLKLMENDALGGHGSRGSGRIKFYDLKIDGIAVNLDEVKL